MSNRITDSGLTVSREEVGDNGDYPVGRPGGDCAQTESPSIKALTSTIANNLKFGIEGREELVHLPFMHRDRDRG
jgi:hypothetical protein